MTFSKQKGRKYESKQLYKNKFDNKSDNIENHFRELTKMVKTSTKVTDYTESIFDNIRHTDKMILSIGVLENLCRYWVIKGGRIFIK